MPQPPEQGRRPEQLRPPFLLSSRFESKHTSQAPYDFIQAIVRDKDVDFSAFRLIQNWPDSMAKAPPSTKRWYVVILGNRPPEPVAKQVTEAITMGEPADIPDEAVAELVRRRLAETAKRPYTEIHRTPTILRRDTQKKEKLKRKIQKDSRRHNRGK